MRISVVAVLLLAALTAWWVAVGQMRGMDTGPGTDLGGLVAFLALWVTMMAAMMLPSVAPMVLTFARVQSRRSESGRAAVPTWIFVCGYLAVWALYGVGAYGAFLVLREVWPSFLEWDRAGRYVAGGAIVAAGAYQLTPAKDACLRHCRSPLHFLAHSWREGRLGALRLGLVHGSYCVGCCVGLFVVLFAVGVTSLFWMTLVAAVIFVEKVPPFGERASRVFAVGFLILGLAVALSPSRVPGLTQPGSMS